MISDGTPPQVGPGEISPEVDAVIRKRGKVVGMGEGTGRVFDDAPLPAECDSRNSPGAGAAFKRVDQLPEGRFPLAGNDIVDAARGEDGLRVNGWERAAPGDRHGGERRFQFF